MKVDRLKVGGNCPSGSDRISGDITSLFDSDKVELVIVSGTRSPHREAAGQLSRTSTHSMACSSAVRGHCGAHRRQQLFGRRDQNNRMRTHGVLRNELSDRRRGRERALDSSAGGEPNRTKD